MCQRAPWTYSVFALNAFFICIMNCGLSVRPLFRAVTAHLYPVSGPSVAQKEAKKRWHCSSIIPPLSGMVWAAKHPAAPQFLMTLLGPQTIRGRPAEFCALGHCFLECRGSSQRRGLHLWPRSAPLCLRLFPLATVHNLPHISRLEGTIRQGNSLCPPTPMPGPRETTDTPWPSHPAQAAVSSTAQSMREEQECGNGSHGLSSCHLLRKSGLPRHRRTAFLRKPRHLSL